ncbi:MAG: hypothetical protein JWM91_1358 [Rhodospirillales bacterium]|nr:hypothetical protein [Rhodospirillales bacterium]
MFTPNWFAATALLIVTTGALAGCAYDPAPGYAYAGRRQVYQAPSYRYQAPAYGYPAQEYYAQPYAAEPYGYGSGLSLSFGGRDHHDHEEEEEEEHERHDR